MQWVSMILIGWLIFTAAVGYGLIMGGLSPTWTGIIMVGMVGIGIIISVTKGKSGHSH